MLPPTCARLQVPVVYPFGHGLSYTTWLYSDLHTIASQHLEPNTKRNASTYEISVLVSNTGMRPCMPGFRDYCTVQ